MPRVQFNENVYFEEKNYIQGEVYDLPAKTISALGDSVERVAGDAEPVNPDQQPDNDPDARKERDVQHEPDDVQKTPDAEKDEDPEAKKKKAAKALNQAPKDKMVSGAPVKK